MRAAFFKNNPAHITILKNLTIRPKAKYLLYRGFEDRKNKKTGI